MFSRIIYLGLLFVMSTLVFAGQPSSERDPLLKKLLAEAADQDTPFDPKPFPNRQKLFEEVKALGDEAVPSLCKIMLNEGLGIDIQTGAAWTLGELGDKRAVPPLMKPFGSSPSMLPTAAGRALGKINDPTIVPELVKLYLKKDDASSDAGQALRNLKLPLFVPQLTALLKHADTSLRATAAQGLGSIGDKSCVPALIEALNDENDGVVIFTAESLGKIGDPAAIEPLKRRRAKGGDIFTIRPLVQAVEAIQEKSARNWLEREKIPKGKAGVPMLIEFLKHREMSIRQHAASALRELDKDAAEATPALCDALLTSDPKMCAIVLDTLHNIGAPSVDPLLKLLESADINHRRMAATAILKLSVYDEKISWEPHVNKLLPLLADADFQMKLLVGNSLIAIGATASPAKSELLKLLADGNPRIASTAMLGLAAMGENALPSLLTAIKDKNPAVRKHAATALGVLGVNGRLLIMMSIFQQASVSLDEGLYFASRRSDAAVAPLIEATADTDEKVRIEAVTGLARLKPKEGAARLAVEKLKQDPAESVRKAAENASKIMQAGKK